LVKVFYLIPGKGPFFDDPVLFQNEQTVGKDISRDLFFGLQKLAERSFSFEHQVPYDQQCPLIAQNVESGTDWARRSPGDFFHT
jgi:hypothetical protein